jgi:type VI secretion system protein ImpH
VIAQLLDEPHRFQFAQLINILLVVLRRQGISYDDAFRNVLRFRNSLSLAFPASEVEALEVEAKAPFPWQDGAQAWQGGQARKIRITPAFIGLLGAAGTLPLHDTERLAARLSLDGDPSQHELVDVFSNRMIALFYEAWGKHRVEHGIAVRGHDRLLPMLTALAGVRPGGAGRQARAGERVKGEIAAYYAGLLGTRPVSAGTVERVLSDHFRVPVRLEQLVGGWHRIPENRRSTLGTAAPILGRGAALGARLWRHDLRARLHIGPLDERQVSEFLPGGRPARTGGDGDAFRRTEAALRGPAAAGASLHQANDLGQGYAATARLEYLPDRHSRRGPPSGCQFDAAPADVAASCRGGIKVPGDAPLACHRLGRDARPVRLGRRRFALDLVRMDQDRRHEDQLALLLARPVGLHPEVPTAPVRCHATASAMSHGG